MDSKISGQALDKVSKASTSRPTAKDWHSIPRRIFFKILGHLDEYSYWQFRATCKTFKQIAIEFDSIYKDYAKERLVTYDNRITDLPYIFHFYYRRSASPIFDENISQGLKKKPKARRQKGLSKAKSDHLFYGCGNGYCKAAKCEWFVEPEDDMFG